MSDFGEIERKILGELQGDGRLTNQELAERVGLSPSACWRRVKALEDDGVIRRYTAILDPRRAGVGECVFAHVSLERHREAATEDFARAVMQRPEVLECFATTGDADYLMRVVVPTVTAYYEFLESFIFKLPGVSKVHSNFALHEVKLETALPLDL
ncbi:MAG: Lrp/AsnC family transcriptional regulator [Pseudomonadota bacterium]